MNILSMARFLLNEEKVGYSSYVLCRDMVKVIDGYSG